MCHFLIHQLCLQVVHPSAQIIAESGPIIIGENCIIEEYAKIIHRIPSDHRLYQEQQSQDKPHVLVIGANNIFEVGSTVESLKIGEKNIFECKCYVSANITISSGCVIGAGCSLNGEQHLAEGTVIFGKHCQQREALDRVSGSHMLQLDFLRKVLPNYHHLRKPIDIKKAANLS
jgi:dynactin-6